MRTMRHYSKVAGLLIACVVAVLVATPAPALALTPGTQAEWSYFPELRQGRYTGSDLVRFWQLIVWADGTTGASSCRSFADGQFGPNTDRHTRAWQARHGVGVDGQVGPQTWGKAKSRLHAIPEDSNVTELTKDGILTKTYSFYYFYDGEYLDFRVGWGWTNRYRGGQLFETVYDTWIFHYCIPDTRWMYVSW